jgi:hypothetical protein
MPTEHNYSSLVVLSGGYGPVYHAVMPLEIARLCLGILIAGFHAPIADFILEREDSLILAFRERGVQLPALLSRETARNLYFSFGIVIALLELFRLHQMTS